MVFLYNTFIALYSLAAKLLAAAGHQKAKLWVGGRKNAWSQIPISLRRGEPNPKSHVSWFHFASLGEYEQGRPLMEKLKAEKKDLVIVATFFSPSGYEYCKDTKLIDYKFYLPADVVAGIGLILSIFIKPKIRKNLKTLIALSQIVTKFGTKTKFHEHL